MALNQLETRNAVDGRMHIELASILYAVQLLLRLCLQSCSFALTASMLLRLPASAVCCTFLVISPKARYFYCFICCVFQIYWLLTDRLQVLNPVLGPKIMSHESGGAKNERGQIPFEAGCQRR